MRPGNQTAAVEALEVELLLEGVRRHWGHELRHHARPLLLRRLRRHLREEGLRSISALQERVLHEPDAMDGLLRALACPAEGLFGEPDFYRDLRTRVLPALRTWPSLRLWHVGCATGEDTYALAIVLMEEGLWERCRLYASDSSEGLLAEARSGVLPLPGPEDERRYKEAGGPHSLADYYTRDGDWALLQPKLREGVFFAQHHLATDASLNEFHLVVCRHTLLAFNPMLRERAHSRLYESLARFGFLCLGRKESLARTPHAAAYEELEGTARVFRRVA